MRPPAALLISLAVMAVSCGSPGSEAPRNTPEAPSTTHTTEDPGDQAADEPLIGCPNGPWFPRSALGNQVDLASSGRNDIAEAIAPFLESEEGKFWPQEGWQILHVTDDAALLVHLDPPNRLAFMTLENSSGSWKWAGSQAGESCPLVLEVPADLNTVDWRLASGQELMPESTSLQVLLQERECVSGQEIGDRLVGPEVVYTEAEVRVSFAAQPPPGDAFSCQGNPETPYRLELDEPLGERELVSGRDLGLTLEEIISN